MVRIEQLIGDLLLQNNCVIIPSFGGFVAQQTSAKIDFKTGKAFPPSKSILFNKQLINNDGLLINELSKKNNISYNQAQLDVEEKVNEWNQIIQAGSRVELDRIGFLYRDAENNLCFEQDRYFNLLLASFGLDRIHFVTEEDVKIIEKKIEFDSQKIIPAVETTEKKTTKIIEHPVLQPKKRNAWKYIAVACMLPIAFYSFWIPMKTDVLESGIISFQDFNPFHKTEVFQYKQVPIDFSLEEKNKDNSLSKQIEELPSSVSVYSYKYDDDLYIAVKTPEKTVNSQKETDNIADENSILLNELNYIVGCFSKKSNAINLVKNLKKQGFSARIVDVHNGLHRVSAGAAFSKEELANIKNSATAVGLKGWTLK